MSGWFRSMMVLVGVFTLSFGTRCVASTDPAQLLIGIWLMWLGADTIMTYATYGGDA